MRPVAVLDKQWPASCDISQIPPGAGCDVVVVSIKGGADIAEGFKSRTELPVFTLEELLDE
jgi:hypothetical protein